MKNRYPTRLTGVIAALPAAMLLVSGCVSTPAPDRSASVTTSEKMCGTTLDAESAPLGDARALSAAIDDAAQTEGLVTSLAELGATAGWTDRWQRVVATSEGATDEQLNADFDTEPDACWGLDRAIDRTGHDQGQSVLVFIEDDRPVQLLYAMTTALDISPGQAATPETPLRSTTGLPGYTVSLLQPVP